MIEARVYLSLGSNVGDREGNLRAAIVALGDASVRVTRVSSFYETEPVDFLEQAWFLNCAVEGETEVPAPELLRALRGIELRMGSKKDRKSTRLNSSHRCISYAVFCLKKKNKKKR